MAKKKGRPSWFKVFDNQKPLIDSVSDEVAGRALKAALEYFINRESKPQIKLIKEKDEVTLAVFSTFREYIDEAYDDYQLAVQKGKEGGEKRWQQDSPPIPPP